MIDRKCIFITGAAEGIGRATALHFVKMGWFVGLFDTNLAGIKLLERQIGRAQSCCQQMDVIKIDQVQNAISYFSEKTDGRMDVLFNNAGIYQVGCFESLPLVEHVRTIEINVMGVMNCIHAAFEMLKRTPDSRIISMSSASAIYGIPEITAYTASKFAIRGMTEALNIEFERHDITVSDIMVSYVQTPLLEKTPVSIGLKKSKVRLSPEQVAETVWKAANGKKVHWTINLNFMLLLAWLFPFLKRGLIKRSSWDNNR